MIGLKHTYKSVAKELTEGLASGEITLGREEEASELELGVLAALFAQFTPTRITVVGSAWYTVVNQIGGIQLPSGAQVVSMGHKKLIVEVPPGSLDRLSFEEQTKFFDQLTPYMRQGVEVEITEPAGKRMTFEGSYIITSGDVVRIKDKLRES